MRFPGLLIPLLKGLTSHCNFLHFHSIIMSAPPYHGQAKGKHRETKIGMNHEIFVNPLPILAPPAMSLL